MSDKQIALVTGASRGIGASIALHLAQQGFVVIGTATSDDGAAKISQALSAFPGSRGANLNVNDAAAGEALIDAIVKEHGGLQVLVNNAGMVQTGKSVKRAKLGGLSDADWAHHMALNIGVTFHCIRAALPAMQAAGYGRIVNIGSVSSVRPQPGNSAYVAAKHGVVGLTKTGSLEYAPHGIRVNAVLPGAIDTPMLRGALDQSGYTEADFAPALSLFGRFGRPDEVGEASAWLCSACCASRRLDSARASVRSTTICSTRLPRPITSRWSAISAISDIR